jgi:hypothetical protein
VRLGRGAHRRTQLELPAETRRRRGAAVRADAALAVIASPKLGVMASRAAIAAVMSAWIVASAVGFRASTSARTPVPEPLPYWPR